MEKVYGTNERHDGIVQVGRRSWVLFYGYGEENGTGYDYRKRFDHKPTIEEIKEAVLGAINKDTDNKILSGLKFDGHQVWLSAENQRNYIMGLLTADTIFKGIKVKLGTDEEPVVYEIKTLTKLRDFVSAINNHIQQCVNKAWEEKASIDWSVFA